MRGQLGRAGDAAGLRRGPLRGWPRTGRSPTATPDRWAPIWRPPAAGPCTCGAAWRHCVPGRRV